MPKKKSTAKKKSMVEDTIDTMSTVAIADVKIVKGFNPRQNIGDLEELKESIATIGLLSPIVITDTNELIAGHRRLQACTELDFAEIEVKILHGLSKEEQLAVAVAENSDDARQSLNAIELGRTFTKLKSAKWEVSQIASHTGTHERKVRRCLDLMKAPKDIQSRVEAGGLSVASGLEVSKLDADTRKAINDALVDGISAPDVKKLAKSYAKEEGATNEDGAGANKKEGKARDVALRTWRGHKELSALLITEGAKYMELANEGGDATETTDFYELRGMLGTLLWCRGDLDYAGLPAFDPEEAESEDVEGDIKMNEQFTALVEAEAKKDTSEDEEE